MNFVKRFAEWMIFKEKLDHQELQPPLFKEGEVWWCGVGENIGVEISGKEKGFSRPVLVFKKLSQFGFLGIPLSTKINKGTWYVSITYQGKEIVANLSQTRFFSIKRIYNKLMTLDDSDFEKTKEAFAGLFCSNSPSLSEGYVGNPKYTDTIATSKKESSVNIHRTQEHEKAYKIAESLPDYFNTEGLKKIKHDVITHDLFGAFDGECMVGFVVYKEINPETVEMVWLGVLPDYHRAGIGKKLVEKSLEELSGKYKVCEVKTLADSDEYKPYKKTRAFYKKMGFVPLEIILQYPGWEDNPCQIFVKWINKS